MLSDDEVLEGLRCVSTPDECFFNVWSDGEYEGARSWIMPFIFCESEFKIVMPHGKLAGLKSVGDVTVEVDAAITLLVEKLDLELRKRAILSRSLN